MQRVSPAFEAALSGSRDVAARATVYGRDGDSLRIIHDIDDWNLHEDADAIPQGVLTLDVADPNYTLDVSNDNMHRWFSREIEFEWGLYVADRYEWVSLIRGPVAEVERDGALVHFRVTTRDAQNADPHFFRRSFSVRKHTRKSRVIELIARERGERQLDIETFPRRLARDRTWVPGQEPERAMRAQAEDLVDAHLYLRGDGTRRLRRLPEQPSWRFTDGVNETIIAGNPHYRASIEPLRNMAIVRGEKHYKKLVTRHMELDQKSAVGATSIHVGHAKDGVEAGKKITIGRGNFLETRTIDGSYTPGSETIPLVRGLTFKHPVGAPVTVTVKEDRTKPVIGRAQLQQNHPLSSEVLTNGYRPRMKILDRPGIHKKPKADERADQVIRRMAIGFETETGVESLIVPHLELNDICVVEHAQGFFRFRIQTRELSKSGTMTLNKRRRYTPKKRRVRGKGPKGSVKQVRIETQGGILNQPLTNTWTDGANLSTEAATDFSNLGGVIVFEPGTAREELAWYTARNEWTDELEGVVRPGPRFSHAAGTFVQEGAEASIEKLFDCYIDDELTTAVGVPVPSSKFGYLSLATTEADEKVVQLEFDDNEELFLLEGPEGEPPTFDEDLMIVPPVGGGDSSQVIDTPSGPNPPPGMGYEDGRAPSTLPTPIVTGGIGHTIFVRFDLIQNSSIVKYKLHCHTTEDFIPDETTLVDDLDFAGTPGGTGLFVVRDFPDGHTLNGGGSDPPNPDESYEFLIIPSDGSGETPGPYPRASGSPVRIPTADIDDDAITATKISDGAIETPKLAANAVTAAKIQANTITSAEINAGAITTDELAANSVIAAKIAGSQVTADKISVGSLQAVSAVLGDVSTGTLTGVVLRTSSGNNKVEITDDSGVGRIRFYDSGVIRSLIYQDATGMHFTNSDGDIVDFTPTEFVFPSGINAKFNARPNFNAGNVGTGGRTLAGYTQVKAGAAGDVYFAYYT